jgi:hypothetical protein
VQKCDRQGRYRVYRVHGLAARHGCDHKILDWIWDMTRDWPRGALAGVADECGAKCSDLLKIC